MSKSTVYLVMATTSIATSARRVAKLIMVSPNNNNKFYEMNENDNGTFTVNYGRVGSRGCSEKR
ncbi:MAG: hypothetical protein RIS64_2596 [Bacteroidota bacterium]|jgi:poly [ADP-ribose] polymerase